MITYIRIVAVTTILLATMARQGALHQGGTSCQALFRIAEGSGLWGRRWDTSTKV